MARFLTKARRELNLVKAELEGIKKRSANWDLQGTTLLELINSNGDANVVTPSSAMKFTGVLSAVSLRSEVFTSFPKSILQKTASGREEVTDDPLYKILAYKPNQFMNAFTFWELVNTHLDLWGNSFVYISKRGKVVTSLTPVHPTKVTIITEGGSLIYRVDGTGDEVLDGDHKPSKFLHFKDISFDGLTGLSRINLARDAIRLGLEAEQFGLDFFEKGGHSKGVIEMDGQMGDDEFATFVKRWSANANHGTPLLDTGMKYKQLVIPPEDAQFIATREFQLQDIARVFRVPPHLLADLSRATFSNIEHSDIQFVKYGLRPMVKRYEAELECKLLGDDLGKKFIRFNMEGILRGDTTTRSNYYATMKQNKIMTTNEIRAKENMNAIDGGDVLENPATSSDKSTNDE